ncbi:hypothetical protein PRZ48_009168 [Zasmidium cellare]|uniref:Polyketide synthase n=1 Tax=Zasmidium cellare TaxID=395010 RepID=A0ABR0EBZ2_ZASCE|nr:hypothetical protein PRZ48_009168 [Zasmidium cellare]
MAAPIPIAIIGMSCKFGGDAENPESLWRLSAEGRSAWTEIPKSRFNLEGIYHPNGDKIDTTNVKGGHFLKRDLASFDAGFFGFPADQAAALDPQFRLQLEGTYEAMESAGVTMQQVAGSNTSVFAGAFFKDYHDAQGRDPLNLPRAVLLGNGAAMASNRLSHFFDLRGPSMSVDTGCSTTMTAFHQACQSLYCGESDMSIVGGANCIINPENFVIMSSVRFVGPDGRSYAFDERANGYGRGEGSATMIIKRLEDALRDGDPVRAVVLSSGVNQDGKTETITSPSKEAQEALIREVYRKAGLDPAQTGYFEAHGTGTPTGDPVEVAAISAVFSETRNAENPLRIGSVKTNIGHTETASGLASLIRTTLALEHRQLPPSALMEKPNEALRLEERKLKVPTEVEPWKPAADGSLRASINNFGYGGSNSHIVLESFETYQASHSLPDASSESATGSQMPSQLITLSAKDEITANAMATNLKEHLETLEVENRTAYLDSLAYTLGERRTNLPWVAATSINDLDNLTAALCTPQMKPTRVPPTNDSPRVGFVFTGQGAQWHAMGRELLSAYPVFRSTIQECESLLKEIGCEWSLTEELNRDAETTRVNEVALSTPVTVAVQIALVRLMESWGITPVALTSHSSGETPAAWTAGAIDLRRAMIISYARGSLASKERLASKTHGKSAIKGGMLAVGLGATAANDYLERLTKGRAVIACYNSPSSITASGDVPAIEELEELLKADKVFARRLRVETAFHSHHMKPVAIPYKAFLAPYLDPAPENDSLEKIVFTSPTTGQRETSAALIGSAQHWTDSLLNPVAFPQAFHNMCFESAESEKSTVDIVIEVGPHGALSGPIQEMTTHPDFGASVQYFPSLLRDKNAVTTMQNLAGSLLKAGHKLDMAAINFPQGRGSQTRVLHDLPSYPWNHTMKHWTEPRINRAYRDRPHANHDLLGQLVPGCNMKSPTWRRIIRLGDLPWLRDHVVQGAILYPGAGFLSMALEAASQLAQGSGKTASGFEFRDVQLMRALVIPDSIDPLEGVDTQISFHPCEGKNIGAGPGWYNFEIYSVTNSHEWATHCTGMIKTEFKGQAQPREPIERDHESYWKRQDPQDVYAMAKATGVHHGPIFQTILDGSTKAYASMGSMAIANTAAIMPAGHEAPHVVHPITLDTLFQATFSAYLASPESGYKLQRPYVPRTIKQMHVQSSPALVYGGSEALMVYCDITSASDLEYTCQISVTEKGKSEPLVSVSSFVGTAIGTSIELQTTDFEREKLSTVKWERDISFVQPGTLKKEYSSPLVPFEGELAIDLARLTYHYCADALAGLTEADIDQLDSHHVKYVAWMERTVRLGNEGNLGEGSSQWALDSESFREKLVASIQSRGGVDGEMITRVGPLLLPLLRHDQTVLEVLLEGGLLNRYYIDAMRGDRPNRKLADIVKQLAHKNPRVQILEVGAGTGSLTKRVLPALGPDDTDCLVSHYDYTDISAGFFPEAQELFKPWSNRMQYKKLDIERDPKAQGFEDGAYDIVLASQALHATRDMVKTLQNVHRLLKPDGKLLMVEFTRSVVDGQLIFGLLPGWWLAVEPEREWAPTVEPDLWQRVLKEAGFDGLDFEARDCDHDDFHAVSVLQATKQSLTPEANFGDVVVVTADAQQHPVWLDGFSDMVQSLTGDRPKVQPLGEEYDASKTYVFADIEDSSILADPTEEQFNAVKEMCLQCKALLWTTTGGQVDSSNPWAGTVPGFLRTVRHEYVSKRLVSLDLNPQDSPAQQVNALREICHNVLTTPVGDGYGDVEYAARDGNIMIPRYFKDGPRNDEVYPKPSSEVQVNEELFHKDDKQIRLGIGTFGLMDTLAFYDNPDARAPLPEDSVEIEPRAFGVNFRDVMTAMGQLNSQLFGFECGGVITRVGSLAATKGLKVGDRVAALLRGHFANKVRTEWWNVAHMPEGMTFETAGSLPGVFITSYVALFDVANIQPGETVLIHGAAGAVGQAAIALVQHAGGKVLATVGSERKRTLLKEEYGIEDDCIFSSRDVSFAADVLRKTNGKGVDICLNSLAGVMLQESVNCMANFGRFVEIGKRDLETNSSLELQTFTRNVTFSSLDLILISIHKPEVIQRTLLKIMDLIRKGIITGLKPTTVYPLAEVETAFRLMQAGKHVGKIVLSAGHDVKVPVVNFKLPTALRSDASYLVVGGTTGIGQSVCHWLAEHGARSIIAMSRSAGLRGGSGGFIKEMAKIGVQITPVACDVADAESLAKALEHCSETLPPIKGVIQGAMVLQDAVIDNMTIEDYRVGARPKVQASWNLHKAFPEVDFFVMLASISGVAGNMSQANYAAGNSFQDALARHRVCQGQNGAAIDIGAVQGIGYLQGRQDTVDRLRSVGFSRLLTENDVLAMLESAILSPSEYPIAMGLNADIGMEFRRDARFWTLPVKPKGRSAQAGAAGSGNELAIALAEASSLEEAATTVLENLTAKLAKVFMIETSEILPAQSVVDLGVDSLIAVELRNILALRAGADISIFDIMQSTSLTQLSELIALKSTFVDEALKPSS